MEREGTDDFVEDLICGEPHAIGEVQAIVKELAFSFGQLADSLKKPNSLAPLSSSQYGGLIKLNTNRFLSQIRSDGLVDAHSFACWQGE